MIGPFTVLDQHGKPMQRTDGTPLEFNYRYQAETFARTYGHIRTHRVVPIREVTS